MVLASTPDLIDAIDAALPQTQCTRCGYPACRPYAEAIAQDQAPINRCPPGGDAGIAVLAQITGRVVTALDPGCGTHQPPQLAVIDPNRCIGCTLCIAACPVDAIVGGFKKMHRVIAPDCTGCELCIAPCPVDCISLVPHPSIASWQPEQAQYARSLYESRQRRLQTKTDAREAKRQDKRRQLLEAARQKAKAMQAAAKTIPPVGVQVDAQVAKP